MSTRSFSTHVQGQTHIGPLI